MGLQTYNSWDEDKPMAKQYPSAAQPWLNTIPVMQQSVLFSGIRGMDGLRKLHPAKMLVRFYRRCVLISAFEGATLAEPYSPGGGDFTGPSLDLDAHELAREDWPRAMLGVVNDFVRARDEMPLHYFSHMMHAFQIVGAHHPDETIRLFWWGVYVRMVHALHLFPETVDELDRRLGDTEAGWKERGDCAGSCST